ncbi:MAG: endonuclease I [Acidobacteria bacterium]|nr:MAG: endonuclease I [Acidobacteriota bacterium]
MQQTLFCQLSKWSSLRFWHQNVSSGEIMLNKLFVLFPFALSLLAQVPEGYYSTVDTSSAQALRASLHELIDDHVLFPYTAATTDTWDILEEAQSDPQQPGNIIDLYRNASLPKQGGGNDYYNREHTWPKSYGFPKNNDENYPFTDCHHLFLCDPDYNFYRSNKPYRFCSSACQEHTTQETNGMGGESGVYPGDSNWTSGEYTRGTWETWNGRKGDVARAMFYLAIRYEGGTHTETGFPEPDLELTDDVELILDYQTGDNEDTAYMGMLTDLLQWHRMDPPDDYERNRNDVIYSYQGNRNPFIDHPEWVDLIFDQVLTPNAVFSIPHLAGQAWDSNIVVYNPTAEPLSFALHKWDESGYSVLYHHEETVQPFSSRVLDTTLFGINGTAQVTSPSMDLKVKVSFRFRGSQSLTEFFVQANQTAQDWLLPNTQTEWFQWFGFAIGNFQENSNPVEIKAFQNGVLVGSSQQLSLPSHQKKVALIQDIWPDLDYRDVDMVLISSGQPIPAPVAITGNLEQSRHVFFSGQAVQ